MTDQTTHASSERSIETKTRILDAALQEFSANGLAGARMDRIAAAASVNKALIYYYFESKDNLYTAALEMISAKIRDRSMAVFLRDSSPGERLLRTALDHFDRILAQGEFQSLLQQEMMRLRRGESGAIAILIKRVFGPLQAMYQATVREGIASGELIDADWMQIHLAALGANVFYFLSAPIWELILPYDPLSPEALVARRRLAVEFLGKAVFADRDHGAEVAARVLADTPVPGMDNRLIFGRTNERKE